VNHRFSSIFLNERISSDSFRVFALKGIVCFKEENISSNFISHIQANKRKNTKSTRQKQLKENARRRQFISFWFFFSFLIYVFIYVFDFVLEEKKIQIISIFLFNTKIKDVQLSSPYFVALESDINCFFFLVLSEQAISDSEGG
jgi:hypothetical protein